MPTKKTPIKRTTKTKKTNYERKYFLPHARLNKGQRKYCHCLMKARPTAKNAYAVCQSMRARIASKSKTKKAKRQLTFNPYSTNCLMNYDYNDYSLEEVQALAKEKGISTTYTTNSSSKKTNKQSRKLAKTTKTRKEYSKDKLIEKLTQYYIAGANKASKIRKDSKKIRSSKTDKMNSIDDK